VARLRLVDPRRSEEPGDSREQCLGIVAVDHVVGALGHMAIAHRIRNDGEEGTIGMSLLQRFADLR